MKLENGIVKITQRKIAEIIERFVEENYGKSEADNPSWDIESLAFAIASKL